MNVSLFAARAAAVLLLGLSAGLQASPTLLVSTDTELREFSTAGEPIGSLAIPDGDPRPRDLAELEDGRVAIYAGTFAPRLLLLDGAEWSSIEVTGWSTVNNASYGGLATLGGYVFVTDMRTFASPESQTSGLIRIDPSDGSWQRFHEGTDFIRLGAGLDGYLYALVNTYGQLWRIDPATLERMATVQLGHVSGSRAVAVDADGYIYMASWNGFVARYHASGDEQWRAVLGGNLVDIELDADGGLYVAARDGSIFVGDTSLSGFTSFSSGTLNPFIALSQPAAEPPSPSWCEARGTSTHYEWIAGVSANASPSRASGASEGYADYSTQPPLPLRSGSNRFRLQPGFSSGSYRENWMVAVDLDMDGQFDIAGRAAGSSAVNLQLQIPPGHAGKTVRVRVLMSYDDLHGPCGVFSWGEVEDYTGLIE